MTEFEQAVTAALRAIPTKPYASYAAFLQESEGERREWWIQRAGPLIAAALNAVVRYIEVPTAARAAALEALRGASPQRSEP